MRTEMAGVNDSIKGLNKTLQGLGGNMLKTLLGSFGAMVLAGCFIVVVAVVAISKIEVKAEGHGYKANIQRDIPQ